MSLVIATKARVAQWFTSKTRRDMLRNVAAFSRRMRRKDREIFYFHRADDPYCQLMVQIIPEMMERFGVTIKPLIVERLSAEMFPAPERYEAYSIIDAARLGTLYGVGFPDRATVPDPLSVRMATNYLVEHQNSPDFYRLAADIGSALWRRGVVALQQICGDALIYREGVLRQNEKTLAKLGHYASGVISYEGELYWGLDRLDHLEHRLNLEGLGDGVAEYDLTKRWMQDVINTPIDADHENVELFFSLRSPYSYLALEKINYLRIHTGCEIILRPVLPMVSRGMPMPSMKARYFLQDAAREAYESDILFGKIVDPLGLSVRRALAIGHKAIEMGKGIEFFLAVARAHWSEGQDFSKKKVMDAILQEVDIAPLVAKEALLQVSWQDAVEQNAKRLQQMGLWGVPALRHNNKVFWGQDRFFAVVQGFKTGL